MKKQERWKEILALIKDEKEVSVHDLSKHFNVSLATIRRDLLQMEDNSLIDRYHGGAKMNASGLMEPPMNLKQSTNAEAKNMVARYAARLIRDYQMVFIDAGSATLEMIDYIVSKNITVVTIGIPHVNKLIAKGINTLLLGGKVRASTMAITGNKPVKQLDEYYFDVAFIGSNGIHPISGLTTTNDTEALVKEKAISRSSSTYVLADHSKFDKILPCTYSKIDDVTIITDTIGNYLDKKSERCIEVAKIKF